MVIRMAVALKKVHREVKEEALRVVPKPEGDRKKVQYEFPYDDLYLLYDYILKEMQKK